MLLHRIKNRSDDYYPDFLKIYTVSFPVFERRSPEQQIHAFHDERYHLDCFLKEGKVISFIAYWEFEAYVYIEHFAVNPDFRGINRGTQTLSNFQKNTSKLILLEIDPLIDEISKKRYRFYKHLGFNRNSYEHHHPAYNSIYSPHKLVVLSSPRTIATDEYDIFYHDLSNIVMST